MEFAVQPDQFANGTQVVTIGGGKKICKGCAIARKVCSQLIGLVFAGQFTCQPFQRSADCVAILYFCRIKALHHSAPVWKQLHNTVAFQSFQRFPYWGPADPQFSRDVLYGQSLIRHHSAFKNRIANQITSSIIQ